MIGVRRRLVVAAVGGLLAFGACSSNSKQAATTTTTTAATTTTMTEQQSKDAITKAFTDFFNGSNSDLESKLKLLDSPEKYRTLYTKFATDPTTGPELSATSATVTNITVNNDGTADVTYTLNLNGAPTLKDQIGKAILVNGEWKVSGTTFCDLAALGDPSVTQDPACA